MTHNDLEKLIQELKEKRNTWQEMLDLLTNDEDEVKND